MIAVPTHPAAHVQQKSPAYIAAHSKSCPRCPPSDDNAPRRASAASSGSAHNQYKTLAQFHHITFTANAEQLRLDRIPDSTSAKSVLEKQCRVIPPAVHEAPMRSAGVSFIPSGTHTFVMHVFFSFAPIAAPIPARDGTQCSIQNCRTPLSRCDNVKPCADFGCEKHVGLKSSPEPVRFRPRHPIFKMLRLDFIAIHLLPTGTHRKSRANLSRCFPGSSE